MTKESSNPEVCTSGWRPPPGPRQGCPPPAIPSHPRGLAEGPSRPAQSLERLPRGHCHPAEQKRRGFRPSGSHRERAPGPPRPSDRPQGPWSSERSPRGRVRGRCLPSYCCPSGPPRPVWPPGFPAALLRPSARLTPTQTPKLLFLEGPVAAFTGNAPGARAPRVARHRERPGRGLQPPPLLAPAPTSRVQPERRADPEAAAQALGLLHCRRRVSNTCLGRAGTAPCSPRTGPCPPGAQNAVAATPRAEADPARAPAPRTAVPRAAGLGQLPGRPLPGEQGGPGTAWPLASPDRGAGSGSLSPAAQFLNVFSSPRQSSQDTSCHRNGW